MFDQLRTVGEGLGEIAGGIDPDRLTAEEAAQLVDGAAAIERLASGIRVRVARRIDDTIAGAEGENGPARWLARHTGQTVTAAGRDLAASEALAGLDATDAAARGGELTPVQIHEVTSATALDPAAEGALLDTARGGSVSELKRRAKQVRAAATDDEKKAGDAQENRDVSSTTDEETGEGRIGVKGPVATVAMMLALLEPWIQAQFDEARRDGRRERRGALAFDALLAALRFADARRRGGTAGAGGVDGPGGGADPDGPVPTGPPVSILARVDVAAIRRGHTLAGEVCEIDGFGPMPVEDLRRLLPDAAIDLIVTNGLDVFNVTHFGRRTLARQQVVVDWLGDECSRLGCTATRNLQLDHRLDWAHTHVTELRALDKLCPADHRRKTHEGWALVHGRGTRRMVPPDHPDHPANAADPPGDPPHRAAA